MAIYIVGWYKQKLSNGKSIFPASQLMVLE